MKIIKWALLIGVLLTVIVVGAVAYFLSSSLNLLVKTAIEEVGPKATGTTVTLASVDISPWSGQGELKGFVVGNPQGFESASAFDMGRFKLVLDTASLKTDVITIKELVIDSTAITCEQKGLRENNLKAILKNIEDFAGASSAEGEEGETKLIIEKFSFTNGTADVKATGLAETTVVVPEVTLVDVGKKTSGATVAEAIPQLVKPIIKAVFQAVAQENLSVEGLDAQSLMGDLKGGVLEKAGTLKEKGKSLLEGAKKFNPFNKGE